MAEKIAVLLVENDLSLLDLNKRVLTREGYRVLTARSLKEAREKIEGGNPQAAVLDVELPDGNGLDLCRELRDPDSGFSYNPKLCKIPIVFLTALKDAENEKAGYDAGADDYITKPYRIDDLKASLKEKLAARAGDKSEA